MLDHNIPFVPLSRSSRSGSVVKEDPSCYIHKCNKSYNIMLDHNIPFVPLSRSSRSGSVVKDDPSCYIHKCK